MSYDRLVILDDTPKAAFTAKACEVISGGFLVGWFSGIDTVGSDNSKYDWDVVGVKTCSTIAGSINCVGIALDTAESGAEVGIATDGIFILPAGSAGISGGQPIFSAGYGNMVDTVIPGASGLNMPIGRALNTATPLTGFAVIKLNV